jgi:hypothetical protein
MKWLKKLWAWLKGLFTSAKDDVLELELKAEDVYGDAVKAVTQTADKVEGKAEALYSDAAGYVRKLK